MCMMMRAEVRANILCTALCINQTHLLYGSDGLLRRDHEKGMFGLLRTRVVLRTILFSSLHPELHLPGHLDLFLPIMITLHIVLHRDTNRLDGISFNASHLGQDEPPSIMMGNTKIFRWTGIVILLLPATAKALLALRNLTPHRARRGSCVEQMMGRMRRSGLLGLGSG